MEDAMPAPRWARISMRLVAGWAIMTGIMLALSAATPRSAVACGCCACNVFGDIQCGDFDPDCDICIREGFTVAADCSVCDGISSCTPNTLCSDDPNMCFGTTPTPTP